MKTRHANKALLMLMLMGLSSQAIMAQGDPLLNDAESVLSSEQIDIDGSFNTPKQETAADRMAKLRKKLEERNEQMVSKKIEDMRLQEEQKLAKKLQKAFNAQAMAIDSVGTAQAAPVKKVVAPAPAPVVKKEEKKNKVIPSAGLMTISGEDGLELESSANINLTVENQITSRISVGLSVGYTKMGITDVANQYSGINYYNSNVYNPYYNSGYYNTYGQGREMNYSRLGLEVNSKFFMSVESTIRPYLGLGVGYNRHSLAYENNQQYYYNNVTLGNEDFSSSYVAGSVLAGSEIHFTDTIGANLEFKYQKGFGDSFNTASASSNRNPDQVRLENVGTAIEKANNMSLNAGILIKF
ncbi:hypothetical protein BIY24_08540 [Halobacteriovorax marinus]|uniref:hypothetical protein n=1 Tax=Halobacteriovorax marinus TaxID=97084 RepID=UPI000BC341DE|nr:hypothetical protein [Halobacteriovorax marinus]ATH07997.1 hypothetical protein BIY24_08540 [Halobacteriovorax marinus]